MSRPTVGVVGAGPWVRDVILPALAASPDVELATVWARDADAAAALAAEHGAATSESTDRLLADVDVVAFGVPPDVQAPLAVEAAAAGCDLLLEKPIARDPAAAARIVSAVDAHGVRAGVHLSRLLDPTIGGWVADRTGQPWTSARATVVNGVLLGSSDFARSPWRREAQAPVWDLGPHALSVVLPLLGRVDRVDARWDGDVVRIDLDHRDGGRGEAVVGMRTEPEIECFEAEGPGGVDRLDADRFSGVDTYLALVRAVVAAEEDARADLVRDVDLGRHAVDVLAAAITSLDTGEPVTVSP